MSPVVRVQAGDVLLGWVARIRPDLADAYLARAEVWYADLDVDTLLCLHSQAKTKFVAIPKYPVVRRDMTLVVPETLGLERITEAVRSAGEALLEDLFVVDVYVPEGGSASDARNVTFRFVYRHAEKTLKDKDVDKVHTRIAQLLVERLPVRFS